MSPLWRMLWAIATKSVYIVVGILLMTALVIGLCYLVEWMDRNGYL